MLELRMVEYVTRVIFCRSVLAYFWRLFPNFLEGVCEILTVTRKFVD